MKKQRMKSQNPWYIAENKGKTRAFHKKILVFLKTLCYTTIMTVIVSHYMEVQLPEAARRPRTKAYDFTNLAVKVQSGYEYKRSNLKIKEEQET